ncbi:MAG: ABC transporter substrate-binding protein [Deltaproteobacteria bacterium]|nr:ABC transporter substrate-binding protein [Deltaproteobacteria bacterium]
MKIFFLTCFLPVACCLLPTALPAGEAGLPTVRFTQSGSTATSWPLYIAQQKKFFEKNGIFVEVIIIRGGVNTTRAVISNTVPMGRINPDYVIDAMEKGARVKIIEGTMEKIPYYVMARPEIKSGADLKGKTIGVDSLSGGTTLMIKEILEKAYRLTERDYKFLVVGTSPDRYAALRGGSVQATFMGPPFNFRAEKEGFTKLTTFHEHLGPIQFVVEFAHEDYIKSNRDHVVKFVKSMIEATRWLYDPKNKEQALAIHMNLLKSNRESAEQDYRFMAEEFQPWPKDGSVSKKAIGKTLELRIKAGRYEGKKVPSYTEYVDFSIAEEAKKQLGLN